MQRLPSIDRPLKLGVLISGGGTTLLNFLDGIAAGTLHAEVPIVISSQPDCKGVERARSAGLKCTSLRRRDYENVAAYSEAVFDVLQQHDVDLVTLAGFLNLLQIPDAFALKVLNIHPSLIPAFCGRGMYGHHVHEAVVRRGARVSGCTVHFADNEYDHGPIVIQRSVEIPDGADAEQVAALVFEQEKIAYPEAIRRFASGRLIIDGQRTMLADDSFAPAQTTD